MKRRKMSSRKSKKLFRKTAGKTHPKNKKINMMRGGTRF